jgi:superfamily II DNA or RNA helicase
MLHPDYAAFLAGKAPKPQAVGIEPGAMPAHLFDYQAECVAFALRQGRAAMFLDTGLGKTRIQLEWCQQAAAATDGRALLLTPLAVARQIEREGVALGYNVRVIRSQDEARDGINVCNYDRLGALDTVQFGAVSLDESSILKSFTGATTRALIASFAGHRFKLASTATPAPNDHMELGTHSEFLSQMRNVEMLSRWFINDTATASQQWRIKGHAVDAFWDWVASWARCAETPADLGYDASRFVLPALQIHRHKAAGDTRAPAGMLFAGDMSATNMHAVKRETAQARAEAVGALVAAEPGEAWVIWCDNDAEADALMAAVPGAVEVRGSHTPDRKEEALAAFAAGEARYIITKPSVAGMGLNWQHAARVAFVGRSFSYEAWYQAVRRCWRFGQTRPVDVHLIVAEGEDQIGRVIDRKAGDHATMKRAMAAAMARSRSERAVTRVRYEPNHVGRLPQWMCDA